MNKQDNNIFTQDFNELFAAYGKRFGILKIKMYQTNKHT